jgi:quercetin dioxygenase-like cupin family protein
MTIQLFADSSTAERLDVLGSTMTVLATATETAGAYEAVLVDAGPGGDLVPHRHPWEEMYFVIEGTLEVQVGRRVRLLGPRSFVTLPARCLHSFRVTSDHAQFLHVSMGAGAVDAFRELQVFDVTDPTAEEVDAALAVMARHGIEVVLTGAPTAAEGMAS